MASPSLNRALTATDFALHTVALAAATIVAARYATYVSHDVDEEKTGATADNAALSVSLGMVQLGQLVAAVGEAQRTTRPSTPDRQLDTIGLRTIAEARKLVRFVDSSLQQTRSLLAASRDSTNFLDRAKLNLKLAEDLMQDLNRLYPGGIAQLLS